MRLPAGLVLALLVAASLAPAAAADHPGSTKGLAGILSPRQILAEPLETSLVHRLPTVDAKFAKWDAEYPDFVERATIGETSTGHPLLNVRVTDERVTVPPLTTGEKLKIYLDGGHHGNEFLGVELVMYYLEGLLADAAAGDEATLAFLARTEIHATPIINVDGNFADTRKNGRQVDVNRNYDFHWGEEGSGSTIADLTYRGPSAESEGEVKANADFQRQLRPDIVVTMHTGIAEFYWPWGWTHDRSPDDALFTGLEKPFEDATNGRVDAMQGAELYIVSGSSDDWAYGVLGAPGFTFEVHEDQFIPIYGETIPAIIQDQLGGLDFIVRNVSRIGAWVDAVPTASGGWALENQGWGNATNVTLLPRAGGAPVVVPGGIPAGGRVAFDAEVYSGWSYNVLHINATKTRTHTLETASMASAPAPNDQVPGAGVALVVAALVGAVLTMRRRA